MAPSAQPAEPAERGDDHAGGQDQTYDAGVASGPVAVRRIEASDPIAHRLRTGGKATERATTDRASGSKEAVVDGSQFDGFSKAFAVGMNRRRALGGLGGGGLAALTGGGLRANRASAQAATPTGGANQKVCVTDFTATVRQGPHAGLEKKGLLMLPISETGTIDDGALFVAEEQPVSVVAQTVGRLIGLIVKIGDGQSIFGVGMMVADLSACGGRLGGVFSGPTEGDSGDWAGGVSAGCAACIEQAGRLYNDQGHISRLYRACRAAGACA